MKQKHLRALGLATAGVGTLLGLWLVFDIVLVGSTLTPEQQVVAAQLLWPRLALLVMSWALAVAGIAAAIFWLARRYVAAPMRLLEHAQSWLTGPATGAELPDVPAHLHALEQVIREMAHQRDRLRQDVAREVECGTRQLQEERNQLSALVSELAQGVLVCRWDGRIVLYNSLASLAFQAPSVSSGAGGGDDFIGIGRSAYGLFRPQLLDHALAEIQLRLQRGDASPVTRFMTFTRGGQLLRVQVAPVRPAAGNDLMSAPDGFVLMLDDLTRAHEEAAAHDRSLLALHDELRSSLDALGQATRLLATAGQGPQEQGLALARMREEMQAMESRLGALARRATLAQQTRWPLEDVLAADLLSAAQARIQARCGRPVVLDPVEDALRLSVDSFSLLQALGHLSKRLVDEFDVKFVTLRVLRDGERVRLDLAWSGHAMSTETVMAWEMDAMDEGETGASLSVRDVVARHGGELGFERDRVRHEACFRWMLPASPAQVAGRSETRSEHHDFSLSAASPGALTSQAQPLSLLAYTVFDTEATGLNPSEGDEVVQLGAVRIVNGQMLAHERMDQLVNPGRAIPAAAVRIHGITQEQVAGQPRFRDVLPSFHAFARGTVLVAHNAAFDMKLLQLQEAATGLRFDQPVLDTLLLSAVAQPHQLSHSLDALAARFGIEVQGRHSAFGDAVTTAQVFLRLIPLLQAQGIHTLEEALAASSKTRYARVSY
ncbi:MAG: DNA polymerase III subunit epsilon [Ramlibacter sp.]|nr:DNA polymerase III subunit epsilon [Ramlibacter sp.]